MRKMRRKGERGGMIEKGGRKGEGESKGRELSVNSSDDHITNDMASDGSTFIDVPTCLVL